MYWDIVSLVSLTGVIGVHPVRFKSEGKLGHPLKSEQCPQSSQIINCDGSFISVELTTLAAFQGSWDEFAK